MEHAPLVHKILEVIVLLAPVSLLAMLFLLFLRRRNRVPPLEDKHSAMTAIRAVATPLAVPSSAPSAEAPTLESVDAITSKIERAIAGDDKTSLSGLYYDLAAAHERDGDDEARMAALRSAAQYGALHGPHAAHAAARLALGEAAHQTGDLASACEQWYLARTAFLAGGDTAQHALVEKRMRENGCPTDWVLTGF